MRVTHPFHPLAGEEFEIVEHKCSFGQSFLFFHDGAGRLQQIPAVWTDFLKAEPFIEMARGRSPLHPQALEELVRLLEDLTENSP